MSDFEPDDVRLLRNKLERIQVLIDLGRYQQALVLLSKAIAQEPENALLRLTLGDVYFGTDQLDLAFDQATQAMRLEPDNDQAHVLCARVLLQKKAFVPALEHGKTAVKLDPDFSYNHYILAFCEMHNGHYLKAYNAAVRALELDPEESHYHILIGDLALKIRQYEQAERHYREALRHNPENHAAHYALGMVFSACSRYEDSANAVYKAIKLQPDNAVYQDYLFNLVHHELLSTSASGALKRLGPEVESFYQYQQMQRGWFKRLTFSSLLFFWAFSFLLLAMLMSYISGEPINNLLIPLLLTGAGFLLLVLFRQLLQYWHSRQHKNSESHETGH